MANTWSTTLLATIDDGVPGGEVPIDGIAVDNNTGDIYFTKCTQGLFRLKKDDTEPTCIFKDRLSWLNGLVWNSNNILYICELNHRILSYNIDTETLSTLAGTGKEGHQDGNIKNATFSYPYGIAMDMNGDLYITERHSVRKINLSKETVETIAGSSEEGYSDGEAKKAKFKNPRGIAVSSDGTIYVADGSNNCIRQIKDGIVSTIAGTPGQHENTDGRLRDSKFRGAGTLLLDDDGTLLVTYWGSGIRRVDINQDIVQTLLDEIDNSGYLTTRSLGTDGEGNLYVGTNTSVYKVAGFGESRISASLNNMTTWKHIRLFLVGDSGAGKTSVVRWLKGDSFISEHNSTDSVDVTTADINSWKSVTFDIKDYMADIIRAERRLSTVSNNETTDIPHTSSPIIHQPLTPILTAEIQDHPGTVNHENMNVNITHQPYPSQVPPTIFPTTLISDLRRRIRKTQDLSEAFHVWDFAGQEEYYNTHHFFLSHDAIYLLVVDISKPALDLERIKFWLDSIRFYSSYAPIVIVGTHKDQIGGIMDKLSGLFTVTTSHEWQAAVVMESLIDFTQSYNISHGVAVSCKYEQSADFKKQLAEIVKNSMEQKPCKLSWLLLFDTVTKAAHNQSLSYLSLSQVQKLASEYKMDLQEIQQALKFYHDLGFMFYFDEPQLDDIVFTEPQQLTVVLKTVITALGFAKLASTNLRLLREEGRATSAVLAKLWSNYPQELHIKFRELLKVFGLAFCDPVQLTQGTADGMCDLIIPCLVQTPASDFINDFHNSPIQITCSIQTVPPLGFPARLLSRILNLTNIQGTGISKCTMFKEGCIFQYQQIAFCLTTSPGKVIIQSKGFTNSTDIVPTLQAILQQIYLTASAHTTTANIVTTAKCFNYSECQAEEDVIANLQEGQVKTDVNFVYEHFCCKKCRVLLNIPSPNKIPTTAKATRNNNYIPPIIPSDKFFLKSILDSYSKWKQLCAALDIPDCWQKLAEELSVSPFEIMRLQESFSKDPRFSPTAYILESWQHKEEATTSNFLAILEKINNKSAVDLILEWIK